MMMNNKLLMIAENVSQDFDPESYMYMEEDFLEALLGAVVKECANQCLSLDDARKIKSYFGVE
jgi:hypothetical protein